MRVGVAGGEASSLSGVLLSAKGSHMGKAMLKFHAQVVGHGQIPTRRRMPYILVTPF